MKGSLSRPRAAAQLSKAADMAAAPIGGAFSGAVTSPAGRLIVPLLHAPPRFCPPRPAFSS